MCVPYAKTTVSPMKSWIPIDVNALKFIVHLHHDPPPAAPSWSAEVIPSTGTPTPANVDADVFWSRKPITTTTIGMAGLFMRQMVGMRNQGLDAPVHQVHQEDARVHQAVMKGSLPCMFKGALLGRKLISRPVSATGDQQPPQLSYVLILVNV